MKFLKLCLEVLHYVLLLKYFIGYLASNTLQDMHNNAIETRTKLILETETEEQAQKLADFKVQKGE